MYTYEKILLIALFWLGWSIVNLMIAQDKGRNALGAGLLSIALSPLLIWLYLVAVPAKAVTPPAATPPAALPRQSRAPIRP